MAYGAGYAYGRYPSKLHKRLIKIHRRISPDATRSALHKRAAQVMASYSQYWWDVFWMSSRRSKNDIEKIVSVEGYQYFEEAMDRALKNNAGVIFALPHLGSWEIAGAWIAGMGYPPVVVAERLKPPELFELFSSTRTQAGMVVVAHDDHPTSKLLAALKESNVVCLVADRDISGNGVDVTFFGATKTMPTGSVALAMKTGSIIIPVCTYLTHNSLVNVSFREPIEVFEPENKKDRAHVIADVTQKLATIFEDMIIRDPSQWHVLHDEWKAP